MFIIVGADGKEYGPVSSGQVRAWITDGRANLQTKCRRANETDWKTLADFPEFGADARGSTPAEPAAPPVVTAAGVPAVTVAAPVQPVVPPAAGLPLAGRWTRLGAVLLDSLIGCGFALPGGGLLLAAGVLSGGSNPNPAFMLGGFVLLGVALLALLVIQIYLLSTCGQTLGKKLLGIRIVSFDDETNPGFVKAFLLRVVVNGLIGAVPLVGGIYSLVDACFIFRDDQRCIHDIIAGTKVVKV